MKIFILFPMAAIVAGCSTANPKAYSTADAPMRLHTTETNGVRVSVDPVLDRNRSHKYFSTDTRAKGIVPVFVRVENLSSAGSVLVEKEQFKIAINVDDSGTSPLAGEVKHESATGNVAAGVGILALSGPLIIVGSTMISTADEVRHNFVDKEFRNQSLSAGRSAQGFVYCEIADRKQPIRRLSISIPLRNLQTDQESTCKFIIKNETE
jgi:hypothetical protein